MVRQRNNPMVKWPIASSQPNNKIHKILPIKPTGLKLLMAIFLPKGARTKAAILKHWRPKGIPMTVIQHKIPAINQPADASKPPNKIHSKFPKILIIIRLSYT